MRSHFLRAAAGNASGDWLEVTAATTGEQPGVVGAATAAQSVLSPFGTLTGTLSGFSGTPCLFWTYEDDLEVYVQLAFAGTNASAIFSQLIAFTSLKVTLLNNTEITSIAVEDLDVGDEAGVTVVSSVFGTYTALLNGTVYKVFFV